MTSRVNQLPYGPSLPTSWDVAPLKHLATLANGYVFNSVSWEEVGVPIIRIENLNGSQTFNYSNSDPGEKYRVRRGDLLFAWSGNPGTSFGPARWGRPGLYFLNQHIFKMSTFGCDKDWLYWSLRAATRWIERELTSGMIGMVHVTKEELANVPVPLPSADEQRRIANFLDVEVGKLDHLLSRRKSQLEVLDELTLRTIDDTVGTVGNVPCVRLGYLALVQSGVTVDGNRPAVEDVVTLPYLRVANVQVGRVDLAKVSQITVPRSVAAASRLQVGDVLMTEGGDLDKLGRGTVWNGEIEHCLHQNHVFAVRSDPRVLLPEYLAIITRTSMAREYFERTGNKTTNLASTSSGKIRDFRIPLAETGRQRAIVQKVDTRLRWISELRDRLSEQLALLAERRQSLITAAVAGQIDVTTARGVA